MVSFVRTWFAALWLLLWITLAGAAHAAGTTAQTIQFLPISDRPVTSAPFQVVAIASSDLPVTLAVEGPATIDERRLLTLTGTGQVTITATQLGNSQYAAAATAQLSFQVTAAPSTVVWAPPAAIPYGTPLGATQLNAGATGTPLVDATADAATVSLQLNTSQIVPGATTPNYLATSSLLRYEGSTMGTDSTVPGALVPKAMKAPYAPMYRVAFTCDCEQFEFVVQARGSGYRLWVDGAYNQLDLTPVQTGYPDEDFVRVQFPDKRSRQIKVELDAGLPIYGIMTSSTDSIAASQVAVGERVIVFGDSWTGPTIASPVIPPPQDGLSGPGYPQVLGEYFNWDFWESGIGGEGFTNAGTDVNGAAFPARLLTDVCPFAPAAIVLMGGANDNTDESSMQTAVTAALQNLATCLPGVPVYLYGPQLANATDEAAFKAAVTAFSNVHYVDMGGDQWLYGASDSAETGNEYLYFNGHPTPLGHDYLAEKIAIDLTQAFPQLAPAPYALATPVAIGGSFSYSSPTGAVLPAGVTMVTASFTPADAANYAPATGEASVTVSVAATTTVLTQPTSSVVNVTVKPQIGGTPTGKVGVTEGSTTLAALSLSNGTASFDAGTLAAGTHTLLFSYKGDSNFSGSNATTIVTIIVVVQLSATTTTLSTTTSNGIPSVSVAVTSQAQGTPTGTVVVSEGGATLATLTLANGAATYSGSALASGSHTLVFTYGGDKSFAASSASVVVQVLQPVPDFTVAAGSSQLSVSPGGSGNVSLVITPLGGLNATLALTCPGLPSGASCAFSGGSTVAVSGTSPITATAIINVAAGTASLERGPRPGSGGQRDGGLGGKAAVCGVLGAGLLALGGRSRRGRWAVFFVASLFAGAAVMALDGCGGGSSSTTPPPPPTTYTVQVTLTDTATATVTHAATISLSVP